MNTFFTLFTKELRLMRNFAIVWFLFALAVCGFNTWFAYGAHTGMSPILLGLFLFAHILYIPIFIWISLRKEWRNTAPLWLHFSQSGRTLLLTKLLSGLLYAIVTVAMISGFLYYIASVELRLIDTKWLLEAASQAQFNPLDVMAFLKNVQPMVGLMAPFVVFLSLYCAMWVMTASISVQSVKHTLKWARWIVGILVFVVATVGMDLLSNLKLYDWLRNWGLVKHNFVQVAGLHLIQPMTFYVGSFVFDFAVIALLFAFCAWLLDKKVEV